MGSARAPLDATDPLTLLQVAEVAMRRAQEWRTGHERFTTDLDRTSADRLALFTDFREAVDADRVHLALQPVVVPADGRVTGAEALARWSRDGVPVPPDTFIALAERGGLVEPLTRRILDRACTVVRTLAPEGLPSVAVNLSARMLTSRGLGDLVERTLSRQGVRPDQIRLEMTETAVMRDPDGALAVLRDLRGLGVRLSVDDFGTGHSSLAYLKRLPVHEIKIDRVFVTGAADDPTDAAIVRSTIDLAHDLGLTVVAEGVEDARTLTALAEWGCDAAQGFHIAPPMSPAALADWLAARTGPRVPAPRAG
jgi:EAL domain-containing protein (putative c-di-GMP-specific phosphodiesterase class I)